MFVLGFVGQGVVASFYFYFVTKVKVLSNLPEATQFLKPLSLSPKLSLLKSPGVLPQGVEWWLLWLVTSSFSWLSQTATCTGKALMRLDSAFAVP